MERIMFRLVLLVVAAIAVVANEGIYKRSAANEDKCNACIEMVKNECNAEGEECDVAGACGEQCNGTMRGKRGFRDQAKIDQDYIDWIHRHRSARILACRRKRKECRKYGGRYCRRLRFDCFLRGSCFERCLIKRTRKCRRLGLKFCIARNGLMSMCHGKCRGWPL